MSVAKQPPTGTPLSVVCKTPAGNPIVGVTIEVVGLRLEVSKAKGPGVRNDGQIDYIITSQEIDDTRNSPAEAGLNLSPDECILNINASVKGKRLGADKQPFVPDSQDSRQIHLVKGQKTFGPDTPLELHLVHECLTKFKVDPAILKKRVRNLTPDEAYQELVHRHQQKTIRLVPEPTFDASCAPATPLGSLPRKKTVPGDDGKAKRDANGQLVLEDVLGADGKPKVAVTKLVELDPRVGPVQVLYNGRGVHGSSGSAVPLKNVNPINAVGLVRLVLLLRRRFNIAEFHHVGVGRNLIINNADCHDWGRAIDFVGVVLPDPAGKPTPFFLTLQSDWATESVPKIAELGQRPSKKSRDSAWPTVSQNLEFRFLSLNTIFDASDPPDEQQRVVQRALADSRVANALKDAFKKVSNNPKHTPDELDAVRAPLVAERQQYVAKAQEFFQYFYDWAADNYSQSSETPDAAPQTDAPETPDQPAPATPHAVTEMGRGGRIMHPDHHDSNSSGNPPAFDPNAKNGREAHNGHYHIQIGPTHGKTPDEPALT